MATITLQHPLQAGGTLYPRRINGNVTGNAYSINSIGQVTVDTRDSYQFLAKGYLPVEAGGGSGNPTSGTGTVNFGTFPGSCFASTTIAAVDAADPNAVLTGFIRLAATTDHSADEHLVDAPEVNAYADGNGNVIIEAVPRDSRPQPGQDSPDPMPYGQWSVGYAFLA